MKKRITKLNFPVIDLHCHLRTEITAHTKLAKEGGISALVYMANQQPPLDNLYDILESVRKKRCCHAFPVSAITERLAGEKLVNIDEIKKYVIGFSDDGNCLTNLDLLADILRKNVLVMAHLEPEAEYVKLYLENLAKTGGKLYLQHISLKESVEFIKSFKEEYWHEIRDKKIQLTAEVCPHHFTFTKYELETKVNPPLGEKKDVRALRKALKDGIIDVISSDYAPVPRRTGIAGFRSFVPLCCGLVLSGVLTINELEKLLFLNPLRIIESGGEYGKIIKARLILNFKKTHQLNGVV